MKIHGYINWWWKTDIDNFKNLALKEEDFSSTILKSLKSCLPLKSAFSTASFRLHPNTDCWRKRDISLAHQHFFFYSRLLISSPANMWMLFCLLLCTDIVNKNEIIVLKRTLKINQCNRKEIDTPYSHEEEPPFFSLKSSWPS